jgi:hypothetical protein
MIIIVVESCSLEQTEKVLIDVRLLQTAQRH